MLELVAAAYEECGLLNVGKHNVNRFWPVVFTPGGYFERSLSNGLELGPVIVINCNKAEVGNEDVVGREVVDVYVLLVMFIMEI